MRSEISALSTFRGCGALPRPPTKKMTKNKILKKNSCEKKKGKGATYKWGGGQINPTTSVKQISRKPPSDEADAGGKSKDFSFF